MSPHKRDGRPISSIYKTVMIGLQVVGCPVWDIRLWLKKGREGKRYEENEYITGLGQLSDFNSGPAQVWYKSQTDEV